MELDAVATKIQTYLINKPLVILGSGASIEYGLPSMGDLADEIINHKNTITSAVFLEKIENNVGLEEAINTSNLDTESLEKVRNIIWKCVNNKDLNFFNKIIYNKDVHNTFHIYRLFEKLLKVVQNNLSVITTNYDRIPEYAADLLGAAVQDGFNGHFVKKIGNSYEKYKMVKNNVSFVDIYKVHGSLDWFSNSDNIISVPLSKIALDDYTPCIIPPSKEKYEATSEEPYRELIQKADKALKEHSSYLSIGYGFNDSHIQTILIKNIKEKKIPIVILAKTVSESCKKLIIDSGIKDLKYIVLEQNKENDKITNVYIDEEYAKRKEPLELEGTFWSLGSFLSIW